MLKKLFQKILDWFRGTVPPEKVNMPVTTFEPSKAFKLAQKEIGVTEIPGKIHNQRISQYHSTTIGYSADEIPWCSSFVNWCHWKAKMHRSSRAVARSWMKVGFKPEEPRIGDVVIFWRNSPVSWKGHVGFYAGEKGDKILVLGGNQGNKVCYQYYPKSQLLGYRRV